MRAERTSTHFPVSSAFEWRDCNTDLWTARYTPLEQHPQAIDQPFLANWNNKQARGYRAADDNFGYGSIYRSQSLDDRIRRGIRGGAKMSITELIDAMEDAGTVDLRATKVLPFALSDARQAERPADAPRRRDAPGVGQGGRPPPGPRPERRLRARRGHLDPRPLVAEVAARAVPADAGRDGVQRGSRAC